jgi:hypothetical protein
MIKIILINLLFTLSLFSIDLSFLEIEKITLDNGKEYDHTNYKEVNGKGIIDYKTMGIPPLEYNKNMGKFDFHEADIKSGFRVSIRPYYEGEIKNGQKHGRGKFIISSFIELVYEGEWKKDKFHGEGVLKQERTDFYYNGSFLDGKKHGKGKLTYPITIYLNTNKTKYSFGYIKEKFSDSYDYTYNYEGKFNENLPSKKGKCYLIDRLGYEQKCVYKNGKLKIKLEKDILNSLKKQKKETTINIIFTNEELERDNTFRNDNFFVVADTNIKDGKRVKIILYINGKNNKELVKVIKTGKVNNSKIIKEFNIKNLLKINNLTRDKIKSFSVEIE